MTQRRKSRKVCAGGVFIGGDAPVTVQSMLSRPAEDMQANINQAKELEAAGCEIVRVAVPDMNAVKLIPALKQAVRMPVVADIHFDHRLALESVAAGVDKIRINPGNIGDESRVKAVADACKARNIPIRIGVNSGSVEKKLLAKHGGPTPAAMAESAMLHVRLLEKYDFEDIVISIKSSDVGIMVESYDIIADLCDYPLHLGVTEAGTYHTSLIKSSAGIGALLLKGIGDTIRVSMTDEPVREAAAGLEILRALGIRQDAPSVIACPTCGRTKIDIVSLTKEVEKRLAGCRKPLKVAVMGCVVNGPGEAGEADIGIAGGDGCAVLFKKGKTLRRIAEDQIVNELIKEIELL